MSSRTRSLVPFLLVGALALTGCGPFGGDDETDDIRSALSRLASTLTVREVATEAFSTPTAAAEANALIKPLDYPMDIVPDAISRDGDTASAVLNWKISLDGHEWVQVTDVDLVKQDDAWKVVWKPSIIEPTLKPGETLRVSGVAAERGDITGAGGKALVQARAVVRFGIDKTQVAGAKAAASARRLAAQLDLSADALSKEVTKAGPKAFVQAVVVRRTEVGAALLARVKAIPGARAIDDRLPLAPSKDFAAALLGTVGPATAELIKKSDGRLRAGDVTGLSGLQLRYDEQLSGDRGITVTARAVVEEASDVINRVEPRVLFDAEPVKGEDLALTLDLTLQASAQRLLTRYGPASGLVAIRPSTGAILVAASGPGSDGYNTATFGQYAPGSTFKVISSLALLRAGLTPGSPVACPATVSVNGKQFKNYSDYPANRLGRITLRDAVANSCNTAFISSRAKVTGTALADAAAALGFGVDHDLGFPAYFGQVPAPSGETEAAADLIGQGKILASPMAMAAVAASVVRGATVLPTLVPAEKPAQEKPAKPLTKAEAGSLRALMRAVVADGSGSFLAALAPPSVLAKTGTAEYGTTAPLRTHTWMIGAQGDLAVAVFVADGQSGSRTAGPVLEAFLRAAR